MDLKNLHLSFFETISNKEKELLMKTVLLYENLKNKTITTDIFPYMAVGECIEKEDYSNFHAALKMASFKNADADVMSLFFVKYRDLVKDILTSKEDFENIFSQYCEFMDRAVDKCSELEDAEYV